MTTEEIWALAAGSGLDALVAEEAMGWKLECCLGDGDIRWLADGPAADCMGRVYTGDHVGRPWQPSRSIAHAWQVVERLRQRHDPQFAVFAVAWQPDRHHWTATFGQLAGDGTWSRTGEGETPEVAICRAALLAVEGR